MPQSKNNKKKNFRLRSLIVGFAGLMLFLGGTLYLYSNTEPQNKASEEATWSRADFHLKTITFQEFEREKTVWKMVAEDAQIFQEHDVALLRNIQSTLHQEDGNTITLTSKEGRISLSSMNTTLRGDIHAVNEDGTQLFAESFDWDNKNRRATSEGPVRIIRDNIQIEGIGLDFDPDQQRMTIKKNIRTLIKGAEG
jgi:LPS export ABC transporter protein LptC